jgi:hypothetical protein
MEFLMKLVYLMVLNDWFNSRVDDSLNNLFVNLTPVSNSNALPLNEVEKK